MTRTFPPDLFAEQNYLVVGLGKNGFAAVEALLAMGARVTAWDDRDHFDRTITHANLTYESPSCLAPFDALILSPGIPHHLPKPHPLAVKARAAGVDILSDAEILFQAVRKQGSRARFVSVTGTNGKSTTTSLIQHILATSGIPCVAGGNLGPAALALPLLDDSGVYVIEMSSYMLERLDTYHAAAACLLNLTPDHLERHGDMTGYAAAKARVFDNMTRRDSAIVSLDDSLCRSVLQDLREKGLKPQTLSLQQPADLMPDRLDLSRARALPGMHNMQNALAASAIAHDIGVSDDDIQIGLETFAGLLHRQEQVAIINGVRFINDSKATNAESVEKALCCYDRVIWIAGGQAKSGGIDALAPLFDRVAHAFLIGQDAAIFEATLFAHNVPAQNCGTLTHAVTAAFTSARRLGVETVLFSPACASFDQFANFEARGDAFRDIVRTCIEAAQSGLQNKREHE